jgi:hypothetical protein
LLTFPWEIFHRYEDQQLLFIRPEDLLAFACDSHLWQSICLLLLRISTLEIHLLAFAAGQQAI